MVNKTNYKTETYDVGNGFYVDIVITDDLYESWFWKHDIGIKEYMFGVLNRNTSYEQFIKMVESSYHDYIDGYDVNEIA